MQEPTPSTRNPSLLLGLALLLLASCGSDHPGTYQAVLEGKTTTFVLEDNGTARLTGYRPEELLGEWKQESLQGEKALFIDFDGPPEKPFRIRFDLRPKDDGLHLARILARNTGPGTQFREITPKLKPVYKILPPEKKE